ncbi:MAG: RNA polymerase sigma factor [Planctomycetota bacterium]
MSLSREESHESSGAELLDRATAGDSAALEQLLIPYQGRLLNRLERKLPPALRNFLAPEDLLQETFVEVFRQIQRFRPQGIGAFVRWLIMVTDGRLINAIRQHATLKRGGGRLGVDPTIDGSSAVPLLELLHVDSQSPSRTYAGQEAATAIATALGSIKPDYRDAVRLRFLEGLEVPEIARKLGKSEWSVHKLCSRGLRELREVLGEESRFFSRR